MTKRLFFTLMTAGSLFFAACSDTKDKTKDEDEDKIEKADDKKEDEEDSEDNADLRKGANAICDCFNENVSEVNPQMKKIIMKAANSDNPAMTMQNEMMKIEDVQERNQLGEEFQQWGENKEMEACSDKVKTKYDIKDDDTKTQKAVLKILEEKGDCEFLAAMLRMAMKMKANTPANDRGE